MIFLNGEAFIDEAIRSVVEQEGLDDWELVLVDDGSTDDSPAIALRWVDADRRIRCITHPNRENHGMSASRNLGLAAARGQFIAFLDCDDVWLPALLSQRLHVFESFSEVDVVIGATWWWPGWTGSDDDRRIDDVMPLPAVALRHVVAPPALFHGIHGDLKHRRSPAVCSIMLRADVLRRLGGFENRFRGMYEDQVLYAKIGMEATAFVDPRPLALYRQHSGSACSVAQATGQWRPFGPSEAERTFLQWLEMYIEAITGPTSAERGLVQRSIAHERMLAAEVRPNRTSTPRRAMRKALRSLSSASSASRGVVRRLASRTDRVEVVDIWNRQFFAARSIGLTGRLGLVTDGPWRNSSVVSLRKSIGSGRSIRAVSIHRVPTARCDHLVIPFSIASRMGLDVILNTAAPILDRGGALVALVPGPALRRAQWGHSTAALQQAVMQRFPGASVTLERFGNSTTVHAIGSKRDRSTREAAVRDAVSVDDHRGGVAAAYGVTVRLKPIRSSNVEDAGRDPERGDT